MNLFPVNDKLKYLSLSSALYLLLNWSLILSNVSIYLTYPIFIINSTVLFHNVEVHIIDLLSQSLTCCTSLIHMSI